MNRQFTVVLFLTLLAGLCCAQNPLSLSEGLSLSFELPAGGSKDKIVTVYIVECNETNLVERLILDSLRAQPPQFRFEGADEIKIETRQLTLRDNETSLLQLSEGMSLIISVGGRNRNRITERIYAGGYVTNESCKYIGQVIVGKGEVDNDTSVMVLYHNDTVKLERKAVDYSPLKGHVPKEYIPVAASGIGIIFISLFNAIKAAVEFLALDIGRKRKPFGHTGPRFMGVYVKEALAVLGAALVLGFAVTWTFAGPTSAFLELLPLNAGICLFAALSHELSHRLMGRLFGIEIEYRFWYAGSFITILTAFLGNAFGIQGFLMENVDGKIKNWQYGVTKLVAPVISTLITAVFAFLYLKNPAVIFQIVYTTASIWAMAEIIPVRGLDGFDIKNWNRIVWLIFFIAISAVYFTVNFIQ
ncbi:MAG: hypothetical protein B6U72_04225 [Candidatus Altiarchaeales archaeon ex4484_2]|nr:MAG: hypothetical protein B6U72_04225 [Candidatus Altiarchaeales archaeon ex4484_2]